MREIAPVGLTLLFNKMNHALDASLLRMYHLEARRVGLNTASIHDAIFHNINELEDGITLFLKAYQRARDYPNILRTLEAIRDAGLPQASFEAYVKEAEALGFFDQGFDSAEILAPLKTGFDRYGVGP